MKTKAAKTTKAAAAPVEVPRKPVFNLLVLGQHGKVILEASATD